MNAPRGPVFLSVPIEHLMDQVAEPLPAPAALPRPPAAEPAALDALAQALGAAQSPLIVTEEAGRDPAALESLAALAEALDAPVVEAWQPYYFNFPREHRLYGGIVPEIEPLVQQADAVLLADAVLPWHPPSSLNAKSRVFAIGEDPLRANLPYWGIRADMVLPGDLRATLEALVKRIDPRKGARQARQPIPAAPAGMNNAWIAQALNEALPPGAIVVNETITHRLELLRRLTGLRAAGFYEASFGGLGVGLATALGVKHARPDRPVVCTIGDGAFHYNPVAASFGASQELGLPLLVVLFDNAGYLSQKTDVVTYYPEGEAVRSGRFAGTGITPRPEYAKLAEAYGGYGEKVERPQEVPGALARGLEQQRQGRLALIHMVLN
jgi:acetolactate synthase-1/2/3 large subunit